MTHENESVTKTIDPLTGSGTSRTSWAGNSDLNNMWGYSIGNNDSYIGVPGSSSNEATIATTEEPNNDNYTDVTFAAKADLSLPAGTYKDTVIFSAVANEIPKMEKILTNINGHTTMQTVTASDCASAKDYDSDDAYYSYQLADSRDGSTYQVRKLADGNCWMTQNLRLMNKEISSNDSNLADNTSFTIPASSMSTGTTAGTWGTSDNEDSINHTAAYYENNTTYGAYYNWYTATAGSGTYSTGPDTTASYSICPKSGDGNTSNVSWHLGTPSEWYGMLVTSYGYNENNKTGTHPANNPDDWTVAPVNLPFSGSINNGSFNAKNNSGFFWSSIAKNATNSYRGAYVNIAGLMSTGTTASSSKRLGCSVRCVLSAG